MNGLAKIITTTAAACALLAGTLASSDAEVSLASAANAYAQLGVYAGPGSKGVTGTAAFDTAMGTTSTQILDFEADSSWSQIEGPSWLLQPHAGQQARLELSVPLLPATPAGSLAECAAGAYDGHWTTLAQHLVSSKLANAIVRPGWEFNGNWYRWSALSSPASFAACFRHVVVAMRAVAGQAFAFDWNVNVNLNTAAATAAWPGDAYVDYVGVDAYDMSWTNYKSGSTPTAAQQAATVKYLIDGTGGLRWWASFAAAHGVPLAVPEWGLTWRSDGHGGGDDPTYVSAMFDAFDGKAGLAAPVAYEHYFNTTGTTTDHQLTAPTRFPRSATVFRTRAGEWRTASVSTQSPSQGTPGASITAIHFDPPGSDTGTNRSRNGEWVRITNSTDTREALTGWTLRDASSHVYRFPRITLAAGASVKVHTGSGRDTAGNLYWRAGHYIWNNAGDTGTLRNARGIRVDRCSYTSSASPERLC